MKKHDLIFKMLQAQAERNGLLFAEGVLETMPDGYGFLRAPESSYLPGPDDIYVSPSQIRRFNLRTGDTVSGQVRPPTRRRALLRADQGRGDQLRAARGGARQGHLRQPDAALPDASASGSRPTPDNMTARVLDMMTPQGKGQRGLIVAAPRTGKTHDPAEHRQLDRAPTTPRSS